MLTMIRAIIRPEKADKILAALMDAGFPAVTKYSVAGRGKQRGIKIGEVTFYGVKPCARCAITTTNQETAERLLEPLKKLAAYRQFDHKVLFGMNLIHHGTGGVKTGDELKVIEQAGT